MTDEIHALRKTLDELNRQLGEAENIDPQVAQSLAGVISDLQVVLGRENVLPKTHRPLLERLGNAARHFEESHPTLSATVGQLIDMLGQMGI